MRCANLFKKATGAIKKAMHSKHGKRVLAVGAAVCVMVCSAVTCFAADGTTVDASEAVTAATQVLDSVTAVLNITNVAAILSACMGSATLLFLAWWGVRKVVRVTVAAFAKGKLSI